MGIKFFLIIFIVFLLAGTCPVFASEITGTLQSNQAGIVANPTSSTAQTTSQQTDGDLPMIAKIILIGALVIEIFILFITSIVKRKRFSSNTTHL